MRDDALELIREIAGEHGVALDRADPLLILQTATRRIVQDSLQRSAVELEEQLKKHETALQLLISGWDLDARRVANQMLNDAKTMSRCAVTEEITQAAQAGTAALRKALSDHDKALKRASATCAISAAIVVLAAGCLLWWLEGMRGRPGNGCDPTPPSPVLSARIVVDEPGWTADAPGASER